MSELNHEMRESLISKIRALRAKTVENGATEAEALFAAAKAAELMEKYDIDVNETELTDDDQVVVVDYDLPPEFGSNVLIVSQAIAKLCEVKVIGLTDLSYNLIGYRIYGLPVDVEIAQYLHEIVISAMKNEAKRATKNWALLVKRKRERAVHSFMQGLTERLAERIQELAWARQHKKTGGALVIAKESIIDDAMKDLETTTARGRYRDVNSAALAQGRAVADRIQLNQGIHGRPSTTEIN